MQEATELHTSAWFNAVPVSRFGLRAPFSATTANIASLRHAAELYADSEERASLCDPINVLSTLKMPCPRIPASYRSPVPDVVHHVFPLSPTNVARSPGAPSDVAVLTIRFVTLPVTSSPRTPRSSRRRVASTSTPTSRTLVRSLPPSRVSDLCSLHRMIGVVV